MTRPESMRQHPKGQTEPRDGNLIMARFSFTRPLLIGLLCAPPFAGHWIGRVGIRAG